MNTRTIYKGAFKKNRDLTPILLELTALDQRSQIKGLFFYETRQKNL